MANEHHYEVNLHWKQDRKGEVSSPVLNDKIEVVTPPEFPKGIEGVWSPEHLFTAAVSSCLMTTFLAVAENSKLDFVSFDCKANGKLEMVEGKYMMSEVELLPKLVIKKEEDRERAERILTKSEAACLISNSIKSKIVFKPEIVVFATV
ncbi:MAG: OsmC family protein [Bacteroidetes bacterium]|nr:OsmC family protein [Bacteroidota bacterium]